MNLNDKIKQILTEKNISPSHFADEIGIQRSSISHILAGRNKPSLEIVQKVIRRFPDLGINWILDDEELPEITAESAIQTAENQDPKSILMPKERVSELNRNSQSDEPDVQQNLKPENSQVKTDKKIERVIIFYGDGSFQEYKP